MNDPPPPPDSLQDRVWERGWDDHQQQQLLRLSKLSLSEKLDWLEEAHRLVRQLAASKEKSDR